MIPNKTQAISLLKEHIKEKANLDHSFLVGYGLLGISKLLNLPEKEQEYAFVLGLLHDLDLECFGEDINKHTLVTEKILQEKGINQELIEDIKSHNEAVGVKRNSDLRNALYSLDGLTGIIRAYVLMRPDKDISKAETKSILKKLKDKYFAAAVNREQIYLCEKTLGIDIEKFVSAALEEIKRNYVLF
ncbi:MAG TPA: metal-dependent phosphohydrolase [Candidatus Diapherotrites archaeon]|nr:metal-dependent phosphohydrolase [Candidatus Diapherotrites archaeon]